MKLIFLLILFCFQTMASPAQWQKRWWGAQEIVDKHGFYKENEIISTPANSIQSLMGIVYFSHQFEVIKDCLHYEIPSQQEMGKLFVVTTSLSTPCEETTGIPKRDSELRARSLSFNIEKSHLKILFSDEKFRSKEILFQFPVLRDQRKASLFQSSVQQKYGRSVIVLSENTLEVEQPKSLGRLGDDWQSKKLVQCQKVNDECVKEVSICDKCRYGYFEVANGCPTGGPKFCGVDKCGMKGMPACRRGYLYQNGEQTKMDCRLDHSFAFCQKGLRLRCQGSLAICD